MSARTPHPASSKPKTPSSAPKKAKSTRLHMRLSDDDKELIEYAAAISSQSAAAFVVSTARVAAAQIIERERAIKLNKEESIRVIEALLAPPAPNDRMIAAMKRYQQTIISDANPHSASLPELSPSAKTTVDHQEV